MVLTSRFKPLSAGLFCLGRLRLPLSCAFILFTLFATAFGNESATDFSKIAGPNACGECHKDETASWQHSRHFKTFQEMPRSEKAKEIAAKIGVRRINSRSLCLNCHFTVQGKDDTEKPVSGISCESCHGAGMDWIKLHSSFSGKTEKTETKAEQEARWKLADSKGMIRPSSIYGLAKNCYGCHVVPQEELVNKGGHPAGSPFELLSWSQGEVLHNTWYSKGKENIKANPARKRMLYLIGLGVELETGLRAVGGATVRRLYAFEMAKRVDRARKQLAEVAKAIPDVPEIAKMVEHSYSAGLTLNNRQRLTEAADGISKVLISITEKYDGTTMAGLDAIIPGPDKVKGLARKPGS